MLPALPKMGVRVARGARSSGAPPALQDRFDRVRFSTAWPPWIGGFPSVEEAFLHIGVAPFFLGLLYLEEFYTTPNSRL